MAWNVGVVPCGPPSVVRNTIPTFIPLAEAPCVTGIAFLLEEDRPAGSQRAFVDQRFLPVSPCLPFEPFRYHRSWRILAYRRQYLPLARFSPPQQQPRAGQHSSSPRLTAWQSPRPVGRPFAVLPRPCRFLPRLNERGNNVAERTIRFSLGWLAYAPGVSPPRVPGLQRLQAPQQRAP